jgi:hypothetical protein
VTTVTKARLIYLLLVASMVAWALGLSLLTGVVSGGNGGHWA